MSAHGPAGLTFEAIARSTGLTKGGVQSYVGSKGSLVEALLMRYISRYEESISKLSAPDAAPLDRLRAHIATTSADYGQPGSPSSSMLTALIQLPAGAAGLRQIYSERLAEANSLQDEQRTNALLSLFATEGLYLLQHLGLVDIDARQYEQILVAARNLMDGA